MTTVDVFGFQYGDSGVPLNTDSQNLPFVDITGVTGLDNAPIRLTTQDREGMDGGYVDAEFEQLRTIVLTGNAYAPADTMELYLDQLKANFAPSRNTQPFYVRPPGIDQRILYCKAGGCKYDWDTSRRLAIAAVQFTLYAEDPAFYSDVVTVVTKGLAPTTVTGRGYNMSFDYGFGGLPTDSEVVITNMGNRPAKGILSVTGPIHSGWSITNDNDLDINGNPKTITIDQIINAPDDPVTIDLRKRTVVQGTTNRRNAMTTDSRWFMFQPGDNNIRFLGASEGSPTLTIQMQSAWR